MRINRPSSTSLVREAHLLGPSSAAPRRADVAKPRRKVQPAARTIAALGALAFSGLQHASRAVRARKPGGTGGEGRDESDDGGEASGSSTEGEVDPDSTDSAGSEEDLLSQEQWEEQLVGSTDPNIAPWHSDGDLTRNGVAAGDIFPVTLRDAIEDALESLRPFGQGDFGGALDRSNAAPPVLSPVAPDDPFKLKLAPPVVVTPIGPPNEYGERGDPDGIGRGGPRARAGMEVLPSPDGVGRPGPRTHGSEAFPTPEGGGRGPHARAKSSRARRRAG